MKTTNPSQSRLCAIGISGMLLAAVASACSGGDAQPDSAQEPLVEAEEPAPPPEEGAVPLPSAGATDDTALASEPLESLDESSDKAGCSTVQFCDAPGSRGTVCVYSDTCDCKTSGNECVREANAICGGYVSPFVIESDRC